MNDKEKDLRKDLRKKIEELNHADKFFLGVMIIITLVRIFENETKRYEEREREEEK